MTRPAGPSEAVDGIDCRKEKQRIGLHPEAHIFAVLQQVADGRGIQHRGQAEEEKNAPAAGFRTRFPGRYAA